MPSPNTSTIVSALSGLDPKIQKALSDFIFSVYVAQDGGEYRTLSIELEFNAGSLVTLERSSRETFPKAREAGK